MKVTSNQKRPNKSVFLGISGLSLLCTIAVCSDAIAAPKTCKLENSIYKAIDAPDWTIEVTPVQKPAVAAESVTFRIKHKTRGEIGRYNLGQSNGYGSFYLNDLAKSADENTPSLQPVFFDRAWKSQRSLSSLPHYVFIPGLGSADWYSNLPKSREIPIGDRMWQFSRCRS